MRRAWATNTVVPYPRALPSRLVADPEIPSAVRASLIVFNALGETWNEPVEHVESALDLAAQLIAENNGADDGAAASLVAVRVNFLQEHARLHDAFALAKSFSDTTPISQANPAAGVGDMATAACLVSMELPGEALEIVEQTYLTSSAAGNPYIANICEAERARVLLELGRIEDAEAEARGAAETADDFGFSSVLEGALATVVETCVRRGDLGQANEAARRLGSVDDDKPAGERSYAAALVADARGRGKLAVDALESIMRRLRDRRFECPVWYPSRLPWIVGLAMRAGDTARAEVAAQAAVDIASLNPELIMLTANVLHARGLVETSHQDLREAVDLLRQGQRPLATALAQEDLGRTLVQNGERDHAVRYFEAAYAAYVEAHAHRDVARIRGALHALGIRKRQPSRARLDRGWEALTEAELAVIEIVAQGRTNREAAAELYLAIHDQQSSAPCVRQTPLARRTDSTLPFPRTHGSLTRAHDLGADSRLDQNDPHSTIDKVFAAQLARRAL